MAKTKRGSKITKKERSEQAELNSLKVLKYLRGGLYGGSLNKVSKLVGVSPHSVVKYVGSALYKKNGHYVPKKTDNIQRPPMSFIERGASEMGGITVTSSKQAANVGRYFNEVRRLLNGEYNELFKYKNKYVIDDSGDRRFFETDEERVKEAWSKVPSSEYFKVYRYG